VKVKKNTRIPGLDVKQLKAKFNFKFDNYLDEEYTEDWYYRVAECLGTQVFHKLDIQQKLGPI
jgi:hypothetical protein